MSKELRIAYDSGTADTAKVYNAATNVLVGTVALTESPASSKRFVGDFPAAAAGTYDVVYFEGANEIGGETIRWDGAAQILNAAPGDAMALTAGERTTLVAAVWAAGTRTLTSFGTLVADVATAVWNAVTRTLTSSSSAGLTTNEHDWLEALNAARLAEGLNFVNVGPVLTPQQLAIVQGDEYSDVTEQPIVFELSELEGIAIASPVFRLKRKRSNEIVEGGAAVAGDPPVVTVSLTSEQTAALQPGGKAYDFTLTVLIGGERRTVRHGEVTVDADIPSPA